MKLFLPLLVLVSACSVLEIQPQSGAPGDEIRIQTTRDVSGSPRVEFTPGVSDTMPQVDPVDPEVLTAIVPAGAQTGPITVYAGGHKLKSPFDFTVLTNSVNETEPNDVRADVNDPSKEIPWGSRITGTLSGQTDTDWFFFRSGPAGPFAYTLEVELVNESPDAMKMELRSQAQLVDWVTVPGNEKRTLWMTTLDDKKTFVKVDSVATLQQSNADKYHLNVAKIAVKDARESNDTLQTATPLPAGAGERAYLTPAYDPAAMSAVGLRDYFLVPDVPVSGEVNVLFLSLNAGFDSRVKLQLFDKDDNLVHTELSPAPDQPTVQIQAFSIPAGSSDGTSPWTLLVTTEFENEKHFGEGPSPGRARASYGLLVTRNP